MRFFERLAHGNMLNRAGEALRYEVENHLTQVVTGGGVTTDYVYNGDGVRVKKVASGISTFYIDDSYEVSINGQVMTEGASPTDFTSTGQRFDASSSLRIIPERRSQ